MIGAAGRRVMAVIGVAAFVEVASASAWSTPLRSGRVALLDQIGASPTARHCLTRIREELTAGGFEVSVVDPGPLADPVSIAATMQRQQGTIATIALLGDPDRPGAELWILDRIGSTADVRRIPAPTDDPDHLPEVLAIRAIEVLKASALKVLVETSRPVPEAPPPVVVARTEPPPRPPETMGTFGLEAGLSAIQCVRGPGPAVVPLGRVRAALNDSISARLTLAGLGTRPRIETVIGSTSIAQSFGLAELAIAFRRSARWRPTLSLGAGALYVQSEGQGIFPYRGLQETRWAAALDAGGGLLASVGPALSLGFEIHALVAFPHPSVRFYDVETEPVGFPSILAALTMIGWL